MTLQVGRGHEALRRGRSSCPGAEYFVTCCTGGRAPGLERAEVTSALVAESNKLADEGVWRMRSAVVMRDHVHLLVALGTKRSLPEAMRLFKGRTSPLLRRAGLGWQRGYFDHRMRGVEDRLPVFRYIFLNPYRAGLLHDDARWPGYFCCDEDWAWFAGLTKDEMPFPEWLM